MNFNKTKRPNTNENLIKTINKFSFSSNHISSGPKTKDKNTYQNGLRSKLKREFYLQKFINNNAP